ncbi:D-glycerate dehydrogenase [Patescibacteria group bacterium]|nr:D-glycerate dehydrogenase [Patescibacteria group bacterium]MBU1705704.1 D-glycerate dehydrogenase [Patescibacteria group bacterium]
MKYKLLITRDIPDEGIKMLKACKQIDLEIFPGNEKIPRRELLKRVKGQDIILSILTEKMDREVFDAAGPQLKMIANYAVGFDNIDLKEAAQRGLKVSNAPHPMVSESVAEHTIALIFALAHRIVESDDFTRALKYQAWGPKLLLGTDVMGKTVGIIGSGAIGSAVVRRLYDGFGVKIVYTDLKHNPELEKRTKAKFRTLPQLLKESDFVSLHVPLLPSTRHLISTKQLKMMKKTAFLINTARGPIVDEIALIKALKNGDIAGAGLDTYECEPLIDCNPKDKYELRQLPNVVLTPHTASATLETRQAMSRVAAKNILTFIKGKRPPNLVKS